MKAVPLAAPLAVSTWLGVGASVGLGERELQDEEENNRERIE